MTSGSRALKQRALAMAERSFGPRHYETWAYLNDLAHSSLVLGEYVNARELFERSLEIAEGRFGPSHDSVATAVHNLALVDASLGDYAKARLEQGRATSIWERVLGPEHTFVAVALTELAGVYRAQGAPTEALPLLLRALSIREHSLGPNHRDVARYLTDLAATFSRMGQPARAQEMAARSLSIWQKANVPDGPDLPQLSRCTGSCRQGVETQRLLELAFRAGACNSGKGLRSIASRLCRYANRSCCRNGEARQPVFSHPDRAGRRGYRPRTPEAHGPLPPGARVAQLRREPPSGARPYFVACRRYAERDGERS